jgi:hypothetical protein
MSAMLSVNKAKKRLPSLYTLHGHDLDWTQYQAQTIEFQEWMTTPFNPDRDSVAHQFEGGNLAKVDFATSSCLIHLAMEHQWQGPLSYEWLLEHDHFDCIYTTYAQYLREHRGNHYSYIAKQLGDLQHSLAWASKKEWDWGVMATDTTALIMQKLDSLKRQYYSEGHKRSQVARAVTSPGLALDRDEHRSDLQTCVTKANELMADCLQRLADKHFNDLSDNDKAEVVECTMMKLATRGGRGVDLNSVWLAFQQDWVLEWLREHPHAEDTKFLIRKESTWELVLFSKGHFVHEALEDTTPLLDLFRHCFPHLAYGDQLFTPTYHGVRTTKAHVQAHFTTTAKFDDMFEAVCHRLIGVRIRPYALRRYNATNLHRLQEASDEVRRSHCSLMGTGLANLATTYDDRSDLEKGFLASTVQRFQFDPRFDPRVHNRLLPTLGMEGGIEISVARMIRQDQGTELFALFTEVENDCFELSTRMMQSEQAQGFPSARLVPDAVHHRQRWRARDASVVGMENMLNHGSINRYEFAVKSMLATPPLLQPKDMVYIPTKCSLAEVLEVVTGPADSNINIKVRIATELEANNSMQATYRFSHDAPVQQMRACEVRFPIDLSFDSKVGNFILRKSMAMESI